MSLINDMLRDLEKRHNVEGEGASCHETAVVMQESPPAKRFLLVGGILLLLGGIVWFGAKTIAIPPLTKSLISSAAVQQEVVATDSTAVTDVVAEAPDVVAETITVDEGAPAVSVPTHDPVAAVVEKNPAELLSLQLMEQQDEAQLSLTFTQIPEYRLLENGDGTVRLIISFNQTQVGENFVIPELTGELFKEISLVPGDSRLQLMVDLGSHVQVQSLQFVDTPDQEQQLLIKLERVHPVIEKPLIAPVIPAPVALAPEPAVVEEAIAPARVSKNRKQLSRDKQAYQAGMKQLKEGDLVAAEASFNQAILVNPKFLDARLQLVDLFQQQLKLTAAETVLRQGLAVTPGNLNLRKIYAQLLLNSQRQKEAIELLKTRPLPGINQDLEYYALLAALYQDSGEYETASTIYAQLLKIKPQAPLWWMGMAISLEQSGAPEQARSAYQQALNLPGLRPDLQSYIQGRLQTLSAN